jgi:hypothetical protein
MAKQPRDREDLIREATGLPRRGAIDVAGHEVVIGFRSAGQMSLYCGTDPVFQFNAAGQLRRVYWQGQRVAADQHRLVQLQRQPGDQLTFVPLELDATTTVAIMESLRHWIDATIAAATKPRAEWRIAGDAASFHQRWQAWVQKYSAGPFVIAADPAVGIS